jgi:ergothioneine biosynthesis protein EgtB
MADLATKPAEAAHSSKACSSAAGSYAGGAEQSDLLSRFQSVRDLTRAWSALLSPEDQMVQSCSEASPVKWHLAHTTWFFDTFLLREFQPGYKPFNPEFIWLFNSYYKALGDHPEKSLRASFSRPSLEQVLDYRDCVNQNIAQLLRSLDKFPAETAREISSRIEIGLHHEQQHQELIATDIKHALFTNPLHPNLRPLPGIPPAPHKHSADWLSFPSGLTSFGHDENSSDAAFAFDNESPRHLEYVAAFQLASSLVSVRDYLAFINDGGYTKSSLWLSDGWDTVTAERWQAPLYWRQTTASAWEIFTMHGFLPAADLLDTPVCHTSYYEAEAYARWAGMRLPTEFEWETAAVQLATNCAGFLTPHSLKFGFLHPTAHASVFGAVWQWTQSAYLPYPGYQPLAGALGEYNGKFMSGQMILRGGSVVTPAGHIRATYRNFFQPQTRWQFSGIRLARDGAGVSSNPDSTGART